MFDYSSAPVRQERMSGRIGGTGVQGVSYPSPFFDIAHTYLPPTIKQMFRWCRYYYLTNPLVSATVNKMAEYPITEVLVDTDNKGLKTRWEEFFEYTLRLRSFLVDVGLFYFNYGNALVSLSHPFIKWLRCPICGHNSQARHTRYRFHEGRFYMKCQRCHRDGVASPFDQYIKSPSKMRPILWNPEDIDLQYDEISGETQYFYNVPMKRRNEITMGKKETLDTTPQIFIDAVKENKAVVISSDNIFHLRRPSILTGHRDRGWGVPLTLPVLKDIFYLQLMKKAQEAVLLERIIPLTVIFPQGGSGTSDPYTTVNLKDWKNQLLKEIQRWRIDRNYIPVLPIPVGNQVIGGDGRALLLSQEIKIWSDHIIAGMGVPNEFVFGGLQWSGSNVSLRMLENQFLRYLQDLSGLVRFIVRRCSSWLDWSTVDTRFKPFKMADDLQRKALMLQINQLGKCSDTSLLEDLDLSPEDENELMASETKQRLEAVKSQQLAEAEIQGEMALVQAKYQARSQQVMQQEMQQAGMGMQGTAAGEPGEAVGGQPTQPMQPGQQPQGGPPTPDHPVIQQMAQQYLQMSEEGRQRAMQQLNAQDPAVARAVMQAANQMQQGQPAQQQGQQPEVAGAPQAPQVGGQSANQALPSVLPPRRGPGGALI